MMDTRRTILWTIFSVSLFFIYDSWQHHQGHTSIFHGPALVSQASVKSATLPTTDASVPAGIPGTAPSAPTMPTAIAEVSPSTAVRGEKVSVSTDVFDVDFNTKGASIDRVVLTQHRDTVDETKNMTILESTPEHTYIAQTGLTGAPALPTHNTLFQLIPGAHTMEPGSDHLDISFQAESGGVRLIKTYEFTRGSYVINVRHQVINVSDAPIAPQLYLQLVRDASKPEGTMRFYSPYYGAAEYTEAEKFQKIAFEDMAKDKDRAKPHTAEEGWIAILQHYFVVAWLPPEGVSRTYFTQPIKDTPNYRAAALMSLGTLAPKGGTMNESRLFVGPEDQRMLERVAPGLALVRDYGWTRVLAGPVFWVLENLHGILGNWGWAIIVLTCLIKLVFFPLSAASYKSMAKMKSVGPRMKLLQEKYKDDRMKLNQATMELYKTEKINPAGGCLPILIQIPVFISLYSVLSSSVEMRGAPWLGWIQNLAAPDPFYILPAIMMVSMFVQYKLNPAPPDPVQAKMMMIMPLVFGVTFFFFPAGLVLYWVVNNLLSIAQQWQITRMHGGRAAPAS